MDWGFADVLDYNSQTYRVACFAMICHHCGQRYIEFFPDARQENLFIGMIDALQYMGVPRFVLTDNMKSVVCTGIWRDIQSGRKTMKPLVQAWAFETKLCKPRYPFTKGKVERLVRFVKDNFLADRVFCDLNRLIGRRWNRATNRTNIPPYCGWCASKGSRNWSPENNCAWCRRILLILSRPERKNSFDGFVNYEGRRFDVPDSYPGATARVERSGDLLRIILLI